MRLQARDHFDHRIRQATRPAILGNDLTIRLIESSLTQAEMGPRVQALLPE
ncbi:MAG: hypothetical protein K0V04_40620 [Deltaproteobacteria bacterium]|nr:hypothetical protein [Deltaproteobacteria bacterium]